MLMMTPAEAGVPPDAVLVDVETVAQIVGHGERAIERMVSMGIFPRPLDNPFSRRRLWRLSTVLEWTRSFGTAKLPTNSSACSHGEVSKPPH